MKVEMEEGVEVLGAPRKGVSALEAEIKLERNKDKKSQVKLYIGNLVLLN